MSSEDLEYTVGKAAQPPETTKDVDVNNVPLLRAHLKALDELIAKHNTFDVLVIPEAPLTLEQKASVFDQMANNKKLVAYLRLFREDTAEKVKRLKDGQR